MSQVQKRGQHKFKKPEKQNTKWTHNSDELSEYDGQQEQDKLQKSERKSTSTNAFQESDPQSGIKASLDLLPPPMKELPPKITEREEVNSPSPEMIFKKGSNQAIRRESHQIPNLMLQERLHKTDSAPEPKSSTSSLDAFSSKEEIEEQKQKAAGSETNIVHPVVESSEESKENTPVKKKHEPQVLLAGPEQIILQRQPTQPIKPTGTLKSAIKQFKKSQIKYQPSGVLNQDTRFLRMPTQKEMRPPLPSRDGGSLRSKITKQVTVASKASLKKNVEVAPGLRMTPFTDEQIKQTFELFDLNKNGYVGAAEIRYILDIVGQEVSDEEIDQMIRLLDVDGDGQVNFPEFRKMATGASLAPIGVAIPPPLQQFEDDDLRGGFTRNFSSTESKPTRSVPQYKTFQSQQLRREQDPGSDYEEPPAPRQRGEVTRKPGLIYQPEINRKLSSSDSQDTNRRFQKPITKSKSKFGSRGWIKPPPL